MAGNQQSGEGAQSTNNYLVAMWKNFKFNSQFAGGLFAALAGSVNLIEQKIVVMDTIKKVSEQHPGLYHELEPIMETVPLTGTADLTLIFIGAILMYKGLEKDLLRIKQILENKVKRI